MVHSPIYVGGGRKKKSHDIDCLFFFRIQRGLEATMMVYFDGYWPQIQRRRVELKKIELINKSKIILVTLLIFNPRILHDNTIYCLFYQSPRYLVNRVQFLWCMLKNSFKSVNSSLK